MGEPLGPCRPVMGEPLGPVQACNGRAFPLPLPSHYLLSVTTKAALHSQRTYIQHFQAS